MTITVDQIKELREETGAGIMDVRKALTESDGDTKKAKAWLEKKGMKRAEDKVERETEAGYVFAYVHFNGRVGSLVKLACETDFVAKTEDFQSLGKEIAMQVASMKPETVEELLKQDYLRDSSKTIEGMIKVMSGKTGENIKVVAISYM
jgi:elongation factor Ts